MTQPGSRRPGPLTDLKVLDLAGPIGVYCTKLLADLGADVLRIEPPAGDSMREIAPFYGDEPHPEKSLYWWHFNTSKRGITLDLEQPEGQELFKRLVEWADIGVESFVPGYLADRGLDFETLHALNPGFILTSVTPFGQNGPYSNFKGPDIVGQAMSGVMQQVGFNERAPYLIATESAYWSAAIFAANATNGRCPLARATRYRHTTSSARCCTEATCSSEAGDRSERCFRAKTDTYSS